MTQTTTSFWWVRHAPVAHGGRIYGQTDLSCDCSETALFTGLAEKLPRSATWVTSNLRRTHETAAARARRSSGTGADPRSRGDHDAGARRAAFRGVAGPHLRATRGVPRGR